MQETRTVLELGCGLYPWQPDPASSNATVEHHDRIKHSPWVDVAHDLDVLPWPFADGRYSAIVALDVMEHLQLGVQEWLDEMWRILTPGGAACLRVSAWDNPVSFRDPTHVRVFHEETFDYWDPRKDLWRNYGRFYFAESNRWWAVESVRRVNADPRYQVGDLEFGMRKLTADQLI